ncbi:MAG: hypothetical protein Q4C26_08570, partial [Bacteroidales bacterium]|nr:hypothetical protein [Bacteroidales bacterium]
RRIFFPETLQSIGSDAFRDADNLYKIQCAAKNVPALESVFPASYKTNCTLYVTPDILDLYITNWSTYFKAVKDVKDFNE